MTELTTLIKTEHPYIIRSSEICRGSPVIKGTRMRVIDIALEYTMLGWSPDKITEAHPHINLAQVHDALSYYYERKEEIDLEIQERIQKVEELKAKYPSMLRKKLDEIAENKYMEDK
jgi:uncharacterized protein (DUF433 family)